jgi:hypothetical protein
MFRKFILATAMIFGSAAALDAQPWPQQPFPFPPPGPRPLPPGSSPVDGQWFFRGNPLQPCFVQSVSTPSGQGLMFTNEKGTSAYGWMSRDGRRVTIPDWNLTGTFKGNAIVWPNGDFWAR